LEDQELLLSSAKVADEEANVEPDEEVDEDAGEEQRATLPTPLKGRFFEH
jgi:hypothetical protein